MINYYFQLLVEDKMVPQSQVSSDTGGTLQQYRTSSGILYNPTGTVYHQVVLPLQQRHEKHSFIGTTGDLYTLLAKDVPKYDPPPCLPEWDYSKPTIYGVISEREVKTANGVDLCFSEIEKEFREPWFDMVAKFVRQTPGLIMAGGYVVKKYLGLPSGLGKNPKNSKGQDVDLFLTGEAASSKEKATQVVMELENLFLNLCTSGITGSYIEHTPFSMARTSNCINFSLHTSGADPGHIAQVILRRYSHPSEVLHSFDLGSCQMAYDGEEFFTTSAGLVAINMGINVIDLKRRRRTYESRLAKYLNRGFGIVFPNLSPISLASLEIKTLYFTISNPDYTLAHFDPTLKGEDVNREEYNGMIESYHVQMTNYSTNNHNIINYIRQESSGTKPYYLIRLDRDNLETLHPLKTLRSDKIESLSICHEQRTLRPPDLGWYDGLIKKIDSCQTGSICFGGIRKFLTPMIITQIAQMVTELNPVHQSRLRSKVIKKIRNLKNEINTKLSKMTIPFEWRTAGEGNDLNASFGMERVPAEDWYEQHYLPLGWDRTKCKYYLQPTRNEIKTLMLMTNRNESPISKLPMEIIFMILERLVPK